MDNSPLGGLPAELRNEIYRHVLCDEAPIVVHCQAATYRTVPRRYRFIPGLLATCKQVRAESKEMFLAENAFTLQIKPTQATDLLRLYQDDGRHLWAFLNHLERAGLPPPANLVVRIRRSYSGIPAGVDRRKYGREVAYQLYEVQRLIAKAGVPNAVCKLEASWAGVAVETGDITMPEIVSSAQREVVVLEEKTASNHFPVNAWGIAASFQWANLDFIIEKYADMHDLLNKAGAKTLARIT